MSGGERFVRKWSPVVGDRAARLHLRVTRLVGFGSLGVPVWVLVLAVGLKGNGIFLITGLALMIIDFGALLAGAALLPIKARALSDFLGVPVTALGAPDLRDRAFARWCVRNGVTQSGDRPERQS